MNGRAVGRQRPSGLLRTAEIGALAFAGLCVLLLVAASVLHLRAGGTMWLVVLGAAGFVLYGVAALRTARWSRAVATGIIAGRSPGDRVPERRWAGVTVLSIFAVALLSFGVLWPFRDLPMEAALDAAFVVVAMAPSVLAGVVMLVAKEQR